MNNLTRILGTTIQTHLIANSIDKNIAVTITKSIINDLIHHFGGQVFYLPNNSADRNAEKHRLILADFNGSNHAEIYQKHQIGSAWLRKLLKRAAQNEPAS